MNKDNSNGFEIFIFKGGYDSNFSYLLEKNRVAILIDPFIDNSISETITRKGLVLKYIINTHSDFDHVEGNKEYKSMFGGKIVMNSNTVAECDKLVDEKTSLPFQGQEIRFIHTPGHTKDSMCIKIGDRLFTGDTLFVGTIGRVWYRDGEKEMKESLEKLKELPDETIIYPGHDYGPTPTSTIGEEKKNNRFLS